MDAVVEIDANTLIMRAEPATLAARPAGSSSSRASNPFDAATVAMRPGAGFDEATLLLGRPPASRPGPDLALTPGTMLKDRYEVIKTIGRGGFSYVYLCQHLRNGRLNAVKEAYSGASGRAGTFVVGASGQAQARAALMREVTAISRVSHPGVVRFEDAFEQNNTLYFAMDFVEGEPLSALLARRQGLSVATFESLAPPLLAAVERLHEVDVLHGDIKPANIIVRPDKTVVLIDFGTAERLSDLDYRDPIVTPSFSPPERYLAGGEVGAWSDVYSCAATLAAALAGRPPPDAVTAQSNPSEMTSFWDVLLRRIPEAAVWRAGLEASLMPTVETRTAGIAQLRQSLGPRFAGPVSLDSQRHADGSSVFVSYAHRDSATVELLVKALQRRGAGVWIDRQGIKPGSRAWGQEILNGMRGAQIVLLFSSYHSMASESVKEEIYLAKELRKPIVVARLDDAPFADDILIFLTRTQHVPAGDMDPAAFASTIVDVLNRRAA